MAHQHVVVPVGNNGPCVEHVVVEFEATIAERKAGGRNRLPSGTHRDVAGLLPLVNCLNAVGADGPVEDDGAVKVTAEELDRCHDFSMPKIMCCGCEGLCPGKVLGN